MRCDKKRQPRRLNDPELIFVGIADGELVMDELLNEWVLPCLLAVFATEQMSLFVQDPSEQRLTTEDAA